nr:MAG: hypothetical protein H1Rhizo26FD3113_000003 [Mitovirus sp.]
MLSQRERAISDYRSPWRRGYWIHCYVLLKYLHPVISGINEVPVPARVDLSDLLFGRSGHQ